MRDAVTKTQKENDIKIKVEDKGHDPVVRLILYIYLPVSLQ
jgi:hypothetical protein